MIIIASVPPLNTPLLTSSRHNTSITTSDVDYDFQNKRGYTLTQSPSLHL